ncbi:hypothetical protein [Kordia sp.]|uniref:hypothetical protein n=1 Tax=Kordia sp. TaxID=1965332 RepID=UPI0025B8A972|nr:hypothetical protein [Kordia sp.]MCH2195556.1 hypothetical protein [Kordia sp.]
MKRILLLCLFLTSLTATVHAANKKNISKIAMEATFCDGWKDGYEAGYSYYNITNHKPKPVFITPICPIAKAGLDSYQDGYNCGLIEGKKDFKKRNPNIEDDNSHPLAIPVIENDDERSFCDGWEASFEAGYTYYNVTNKKSKPIFITPICPIAKIGADTYQDGYDRGRRQGLKDFKDR